MASSVKNILIGIFVLLALAIIVFMILFLHPSVGDNAKTLHVRFSNVDKINVGTRVTYAGRPVGEVVSIIELPDARTEETYHGDIYVYELTLKVDSAVRVYNSDTISIRTSGLLGEKNVEIDPMPVKPGEQLFLVEDQILYAVPSGSVEETLKQFGDLSGKFQVVLSDFHEMMEAIKKEHFVENLSKTVQNTVEISAVLNQPEKWNRIINNVVALTDRAHRSWDTVDGTLQNTYHLTTRAHQSWSTLDSALNQFNQLGERTNTSWASLDSAVKEFNQGSVEFNQGSKEFNSAFTNLNKVMTSTSQGKGSIGQLFVRDDLYLSLKSILHKGETIFNDIKQFGVLFQLDKKWQRLQARRTRLLQRLSDPVKFANYFNNEVDQISTSLSSVSMVLNEAECYPFSLLHTPEFTCRFSDLLKRVNDMEDSLQMFNEQVVDME
ncbi:MAG: MCE family protein [Candidatus Protochlamydia sp.]|nr:MCE family protein [Candidatus Protochlamydia sp.]